MDKEIKITFLSITLFLASIFLVEAMLILTMFIFYGFLEIMATTFMLDEMARMLIFCAYGGISFTMIIFANMGIITYSTDIYKKIKNKIYKEFK